jgi:GDP-L-fucose synthase
MATLRHVGSTFRTGLPESLVTLWRFLRPWKVTDQGVFGMKVDGSVVVVTGGTGLLGQSVSRVLRAAGAQVLAVGRQDFDLRQHRQVYDMLRSIRPDAVVHLAANRHGAAESVLSHYDNVIMGVELLEGCRRQRVGKVLLAERSCAFPAVTTGRLDQVAADPDTDLDAAAHQMLRTHLDVYRQSARLNVSSLALTNVYDASPGYSPELGVAVRTMLAAFRAGGDEVRLAASASSMTEFLHITDAARAVRDALEADQPDGVADSGGRGVTLAEVAAITAEVSGFRGRITWMGEPDGQRPSTRNEAMRDFVEWCATARETAQICA